MKDHLDTNPSAEIFIEKKSSENWKEAQEALPNKASNIFLKLFN